jgi:hypothetical protein
MQGLKEARIQGKIPAFAFDRVSTVDQANGMSQQYQSQGATRYDEAVGRARFAPNFALYLQMLFDETLKNNKKDSRREILSLKRRISSMEVKKDRLYNLYLEDEYFSQDDLKRKLEIFDREIKGLKQHLKTMSMDNEKVCIEITHVINTFRDFPVRYAAADRAKTQQSSGEWPIPQCLMLMVSPYPGKSPLPSLCGKKLPL